MSYKDNFNVFVGGTSGFFKGVNVKRQSCVIKNIQNLVSITDHHEVTCMSWGDDEEKEILLGCGAKGIRSVKTYDTDSHTFKTSFTCDYGEGKMNGIARYDGHILTAVDSGHVKLWKHNEKEENVLNVGGNLLRMRQANELKNIIATGGDENPLKLFDLKTNMNIFTAKNERHDELQLKVSVNVTDMRFLTDTKIVTVGKYGHVRLYDIRAQRRSVINLHIEEEALTTLSNCWQDRQIVCGNGRGKMNLIDLRKHGRILNTYKGPIGAVTAIGISQIEPCLVSVGLDRYLYVHNINTHALLKKVYLNSKLSCMVVRSGFSMTEIEKEENAANGSDDDFVGSEVEYTDNESEEEM